MRAVYQLLAGFSRRDAISNEALLLRSLFRSWGWKAAICCDPSCTHPELRGEIIAPAELQQRCGTEDIAFLHLSIGSDINDLFAELPCHKVILYHNITPPEFLEAVNPGLAARLRRGREQMARLAGTARLVLADSRYNAAELEQHGYREVQVMPILLDLERLKPRAASRIRARRRSGASILFVGRCAPNKRLEHLILLLAHYRRYCDGNARLVLVGSYAGMEKYYCLLVALARKLGVDDAVEFAGSRPQAELNAIYRSSKVFVSMSEHEGFCVPILEAMYHRLPVMAYAAGAVPETMGGAGILFSEKDFPLLAETLERIVRDATLREAVLRRQDQRMAQYDPAREARRLRQLLQAFD
ncbi:MAG: hypothetical protein DRP22_00965 [Verrucomicrobia bacterium]|nr:MAG: hypothetical protein DRP22_00965 [Verrucomicrobiota bacterium]